MIDNDFVTLKQEAIHRINLPYGLTGKDIKFARMTLGLSRITLAYDLHMKPEEIKDIEMGLDPVPDYLLEHMKFLLGEPDSENMEENL